MKIKDSVGLLFFSNKRISHNEVCPVIADNFNIECQDFEGIQLKSIKMSGNLSEKTLLLTTCRSTKEARVTKHT